MSANLKAQTLIKSLYSFFTLLNQQYGFEIDAGSMENAISHIQDFCDEKGVLYTTQSAICKTKEQSDKYESLFCQKFLGYKQNPSLPKEKNNGKESIQGLEKSVRVLEDTISHKQKMLNDAMEKIEEACAKPKDYETQKNKALQNKENVSAQLAQARNEYNKTVQDALNTIYGEKQTIKKLNSLMRNEAKSKNCTKYKVDMDRIKEHITALDKKELNDAINQVMNGASMARRAKDISTYNYLMQLAMCLQEMANKFTKGNAKETGKAFTAKEKVISKEEEFSRASESLEEQLREEKKDAERLKQYQENAKLLTNDIRIIQNKIQVKESSKAMLIQSKNQSTNHREVFLNGHNAVQREDAIETLLQTPVEALSQFDMKNILTYIRTAAKTFCQTLRKKHETNSCAEIDMKETIRNSMKTDGEIAKIIFRKPIKSKANVILLADISGSCRSSASLALTFMGLMGNAFPGGCHLFSFVNSLHPADRYFKKNSINKAVQKITAEEKSKGIYSDYGRPIKELAQNYKGLFSKQTTLVILGDCRNNKRDLEEESFCWLREHTHQIIVMNNESPQEWGKGDSAAMEYQKLGAKVVSIETTQQLLDCLVAL